MVILFGYGEINGFLGLAWTFNITSPCNIQAPTLVCDLMSSPGVWNHKIIKNIFLPHDVVSILSHSIS